MGYVSPFFMSAIVIDRSRADLALLISGSGGCE